MVSNEDFSSQVNAKLDEKLSRFLEKSRETTSEMPFPGLKEHVEGVTEAVNKKKQEAGSVKHKQLPISENLSYSVSCKVDWVKEPVQTTFGPTISLEQGVTSGRATFGLGLNVAFDQTNISRQSGVAVSLSANKNTLKPQSNRGYRKRL